MKHLCLLFFFTVSYANAQQTTITGQILNSNNIPISLATIDIVGSNTSDVSDDYGIFHLKLPNKVKRGDIIVLRVSKNGYNTFTKKVSVSFLTIPIKLIKSKNLKGTSSDRKANKLVSSPIIQQNSPVTNNASSYFQSGGITANQVIIEPIGRKLDIALSSQLVNNLPNKNEKIDIICLIGDSEGLKFATEILSYLKSKGYKNVYGVSQDSYAKPLTGQYLDRDSSGVKITIGTRQ